LGHPWGSCRRSRQRMAVGYVNCSNLPLDLSPVSGGTLSGQESQRAMARRLKLSVRHNGSRRGCELSVVGCCAHKILESRKVCLARPNDGAGRVGHVPSGRVPRPAPSIPNGTKRHIESEYRSRSSQHPTLTEHLLYPATHAHGAHLALTQYFLPLTSPHSTSNTASPPTASQVPHSPSKLLNSIRACS
jgi:hypothetical protein